MDAMQRRRAAPSPTAARQKRRVNFRLVEVVALACALVLLGWTAAYAQADEPLPAGAADGAAVSADDGGPWELGVHGSAGDLTAATAAERTGMWVWLNGWFVQRYSYGENLAWEQDFKRSALGGYENYYIDAVDLQFYVGHGAPGWFSFHNASHTDAGISAPNDCNTSWGDGDNDWFALTSCQVLADSAIGRMAQCMYRQHLILGFVTNASAHNNYWDTQAYHYGLRLRVGYSQTQAWFSACDVAQRGRTTRVIAEEVNCFNDNPYWGSVCADTYDNDYYWQTHACGTASASYVPAGEILELPVMAVAPYSLDDATADFQALGNAFNVPVTETLRAAGLLGTNEDVDPPTNPADSPFLVANSGGTSGDNPGTVLTMDDGSGLYQFSDLNNLFSSASVQAAYSVNAAAADYIDGVDARRIADTFLNNNGLMDGGAVFYETVQDTAGNLPRGNVSAADVAQAEVPTNWQVIYTRVLNQDVVNAAGASVPVTFTVVGPGAKLKVYVPLTGQVNAAGEVEAAPIGAQGGWRNVQPLVNAATGEAVMTTILDPDTAAALYLALDDKVTMNTLPMTISNRSVLSSTLAYWESVAGASQGELIPVYELTVDITEAETGQHSTEFVYLPASPKYMRPFADITNAPLSAMAGSTISVTAAAANQTLAQNGYAGFNFAMGYDGEAGDYIYEWYLNQNTPDARIAGCTSRTCTFTVPSNIGEKESTFTVLLVVKDASSPNQSEGTDAVDVLVPTLFLPTVTKQ